VRRAYRSDPASSRVDGELPTASQGLWMGDRGPADEVGRAAEEGTVGVVAPEDINYELGWILHLRAPGATGFGIRVSV